MNEPQAAWSARTNILSIRVTITTVHPTAFLALLGWSVAILNLLRSEIKVTPTGPQLLHFTLTRLDLAFSNSWKH